MPNLASILSIRKKRLDLQRQADTLEQEEKSLTEEVIQDMVARGLTLLQDGEDQVILRATDEPNVTSWPALLDYIVTNQAPELLQKRLTPSAVKERWKDGVTIPGVESVIKRTLKFNV